MIGMEAATMGRKFQLSGLDGNQGDLCLWGHSLWERTSALRSWDCRKKSYMMVDLEFGQETPYLYCSSSECA